MQRELVCVCFAPLVYSVMIIGFVFFPLIVVTAPAYACAVGQLMLSATMKIVRLSSYRRLCRSADENLFQEFVRKRNQKKQ